MTVSLTLRTPRRDDEAELRRIHEQMCAEGFTFLLVDGTWDEVLATIEREARGVDLDAGRVRAEFLVAEADGVPVGRVSIRYALNDFLLNEGGHIGYGVAPEFRRRGYATQILRRSVTRLAAAGVERILVTCADANTTSARVIERCGGQLEDLRTAHDGTLTRRYWIDAR
ncbi:MAG: GNAT family N-acetyltransferase [Brevibacterium sp.]